MLSKDAHYGKREQKKTKKKERGAFDVDLHLSFLVAFNAIQEACMHFSLSPEWDGRVNYPGSIRHQTSSMPYHLPIIPPYHHTSGLYS